MKKCVVITIVLVSLLAAQVFAAQTMKIAVAADKTPTAAVSDQMGAAPYFLFFDGKGKLLEAIENPYKNAESPGPSVVNYLAGKGAKVAVAGGFGAKIVEVMKAKDITAVSFKGSAQDAVKKVLQSK
jgi:predicted Fe-Mo cluster-binding NifX family protein